eukprot:4199485-Karenia_brevis.AAC.1
MWLPGRNSGGSRNLENLVWRVPGVKILITPRATVQAQRAAYLRLRQQPATAQKETKASKH